MEIKTLSLGGRLTLTKVVLGSHPAFYFLLFFAPIGVINTLESIRRKFVWRVREDGKRKVNWVSWKNVISSKDPGALGLGSLRAINLSLIIKWWWRIRIDRKRMWSRAIINIHNLINRAAYCMLKKTITRVWNNIVGVKDDLLKTRININQVIKKQVGAGDNTLFW